MGVRERRGREKSATRDKILDAARELFLACGYEGVTMRKVAQAIEYSPTAIYVHFADKEALFRELCVTDFRKLAHVFREIAAIADPAERLLKAGLAYADFGASHPNHYRVMFMTPHPARGHSADLEKGNPEEDAYAFLKATVKDALRAGRFRPELKDAELIAQTLWAGVHGVVSLEIAKRDDAWVDWRDYRKRVRLMTGSLLRGLLK
ncbi:MAG TPA: TetR/AcrR family transcriptional regulator [Clostridia bacterium]|nr:TetR/AcrR family transcriptional regulator [Clostridia bacterium]